jgi:hypothetical protein
VQTFADLLPAELSGIRAHHEPSIPEWFPPVYPAPTKEVPNPLPRSDAERAMLRRNEQRREASTGPYDGQRVIVAYRDGTAPPELYEPAPGWHYRLDRKASTPHHLRYRYDPNCPAHAYAMRGVVEAYVEHGPEYTAAARLETPDDRPAPAPR